MKERAKRLGKWLRPNYLGLIGGVVLFCFSLTPSLLPMGPLYSGLVSGISFTLGYLIGVIISWGVRKLIHVELPHWTKDIAWVILIIGLPVVMITYIVWSAGWQNDVRRMVGEQPIEGYHFVTIISIAVLVAFVLMLLGRSIAWLANKFGNFARRWVPSGVGTGLGILATIVIIFLIYNGVLVNTFVTVSNNIYRDTNDLTKPGATQPQNSMRSGSPASLVPWHTLGRQGRSFVSSGPTQQQIAEINGEESKQPIRVYAGVQSAATPEERARLAVQELTRTGAFHRDVLAVATATGTGWIEPQSADALEYVWNGNTAIATMQYSYLPSWISFLVDRENAALASRALFDAVYEHWSTLPEDDRPKLLVYGLSLGAYGAQAAFSGVDDLQNRTDGALFMGSPSFSQPWGYFTKGRDRGTPEWQPTYQQGKAVRFAASSSDLEKINTPWDEPRILYMQHASDPVVWWNADLILNQPDWLKEDRGSDVTTLMKWYPFITFTQVTVNQFFAVDAPSGHGHNYGNSVSDAWAAIAQPPDWNQEKADKLRQLIQSYPTN
jgi:uncharacterized membrane protein